MRTPLLLTTVRTEILWLQNFIALNVCICSYDSQGFAQLKQKAQTRFPIGSFRLSPQAAFKLTPVEQTWSHTYFTLQVCQMRSVNGLLRKAIEEEIWSKC